MHCYFILGLAATGSHSPATTGSHSPLPPPTFSPLSHVEPSLQFPLSASPLPPQQPLQPCSPPPSKPPAQPPSSTRQQPSASDDFQWSAQDLRETFTVVPQPSPPPQTPPQSPQLPPLPPPPPLPPLPPLWPGYTLIESVGDLYAALAAKSPVLLHLGPGSYFTLDGGQIEVDGAAVNITSEGAGATLDAKNLHRHFIVSNGGRLALRDIHLRNGQVRHSESEIHC